MKLNTLLNKFLRHTDRSGKENWALDALAISVTNNKLHETGRHNLTVLTVNDYVVVRVMLAANNFKNIVVADYKNGDELEDAILAALKELTA